jgi:hypothetical protein
MIDLFQLYEKVCGSVNTQQGGHIRPHRNFVDWANDVSIELFEEYVAVAGKNQQITDYLSPFQKSANVIVNPVSGAMYDFVKFPQDYDHFSSARVYYDSRLKGCAKPELDLLDGKTGQKCESPYRDEDDLIRQEQEAEEGLNEVPITKVGNQRWGSLLKHRTMAPTPESPKATNMDGGLRIAPKGLGIIVLDYYRKPAPATFEYTITNPGDIDEYLQYKEADSKKLEWSSILINEFINRIGKKYGKYIRESFVYETSEKDRNVTI